MNVIEESLIWFYLEALKKLGKNSRASDELVNWTNLISENLKLIEVSFETLLKNLTNKKGELNLTMKERKFLKEISLAFNYFNSTFPEPSKLKNIATEILILEQEKKFAEKIKKTRKLYKEKNQIIVRSFCIRKSLMK